MSYLSNTKTFPNQSKNNWRNKAWRAFVVYVTESVFQHIYSLYHQRVYHAAQKVLRDPQLAEDAAQETFIKAYRNLDKLEDVSKAGAWLATIASRTAIDMLRKEGKRKFISIELASWELELALS